MLIDHLEGHNFQPQHQVYSIDNIFPAVPDSFYAVTATGEVSLSWSEPSDEDFAYHNIYRNNLMDENPAVIFINGGNCSIKIRPITYNLLLSVPSRSFKRFDLLLR